MASGATDDQATTTPSARISRQSRTTPTPTERRAIRSNYRNLKTVISGEKEYFVRDCEKFTKLIGDYDDLYKQVERPREQVADAETMYDITNSLLECIKKFHRKTGPTAAEFIAAISRKFGKPAAETENGQLQLDWGEIGLQALGIISVTSGVLTMIGPMDITAKNIRKSLKRRREKAGECSRPEQVDDADKEEIKETDNNMETMFRILRNLKSARLEALILNRLSFSQTIENLFALSFLIKDGRVEMAYDEHGNHQLVPRNAPEIADRASGLVRNSQFVLRFGYDDWKLMKNTVEEGEELMPHRHNNNKAS